MLGDTQSIVTGRRAATMRHLGKRACSVLIRAPSLARRSVEAARHAGPRAVAAPAWRGRSLLAEQLQHALTSRIAIEQAEGVLAVDVVPGEKDATISSDYPPGVFSAAAPRGRIAVNRVPLGSGLRPRAPHPSWKAAMKR
jgi:hypothetical protein